MIARARTDLPSRIVPLLLIAGPVLVLAVSMAWPLASIFLRSLNASGRPRIEGEIYWGNYTAILQDELLRQVAVHSIWLSLLATVLTVLLAFPAAYLISRLSGTASKLLMILLVLPFWVSIIVRLFAFTTILGRFGIVNTVADGFGLGPFPLLYNSFAVAVGMVAYLLPYMVLILISAMSALDMSLLSAARTMGASEGRVFRDIYLPQVRPAVLGGAVLIFVLGLGFFLTPVILGGPRNLTIPVFIQQQVQSYQWGKASAMGIALLAVSTIGYLIAMRLGGRGILAPSQRGTRGTTAKTPLRMSPAIAFCIAVLVFDLAILVLPLLIVIPTSFTETSQIVFPPRGFSLKWYAEVLSSPVWLEALWKSVRVGIGTAIVATVCGFALARVGTRSASRALGTAIQVLAITPIIVPVILLGIGVYDIQGRLGLLGTDFGLIITHAVLCIPLTFIVMATALSSVDRALEQAAWTMGAGRMHTFRTVVLPPVIPAVMGAALISFATSWDEAVLAMFQSDLEKTLPVTIYSYLRSGITPAVSAVASLVIIPAIVGSLVIAVRAGLRSRKQKRETA